MRLLSRMIAGLFALGVAVAVWVMLLPDPHAPTASVARATVEPSALQAAPVPGREVRVVYPDANTAGATRADAPKSEARIAPTPAPSVPAQASGPSAPPAATAVASAQPASPEATPPSLPPAGGTDAQAGTAVNLNTASVEALNRIPGGGAIGRTIIAHRPYRSVDDLVNRRVLRRSVFERIKQQVAAD